jgi:hypothetical protein
MNIMSGFFLGAVWLWVARCCGDGMLFPDTSGKEAVMREILIVLFGLTTLMLDTAQGPSTAPADSHRGEWVLPGKPVTLRQSPTRITVSIAEDSTKSVVNLIIETNDSQRSSKYNWNRVRVGDTKEFTLRDTAYQLEVLELDEVGVRLRLTELGKSGVGLRWRFGVADEGNNGSENEAQQELRNRGCCHGMPLARNISLASSAPA